jgi:hypothetical protein
MRSIANHSSLAVHQSGRLPQLVAVLFSGVLLMGLCHMTALTFGAQFWQLERIFHLGREGNAPTWFSSMLLFFAGLLAFDLSRKAERTRRFVFVTFGVIFLFLSCDETASLHETISQLIKTKVVWTQFLDGAFPATKWPIYVGPPVMVGSFFAVRHAKHAFGMNSNAFRLFVIGGSLFFLAAFGLELTENLLTTDSLAPWRPVNIFVEELFEMTGVVFVIWSFLCVRMHLEVKDQELNICRG